jgi:hypothetical protein
MRKRLVIGAAAALFVAALGSGVAGAAPTPKYTVTCTIGGNTTAKWQRVMLSHITFVWSALPGSTTSFPGSSSPVPTTWRHGLAVLGTPGAVAGVDPATVTVTFEHADGSAADQVTADCT